MLALDIETQDAAPKERQSPSTRACILVCVVVLTTWAFVEVLSKLGVVRHEVKTQVGSVADQFLLVQDLDGDGLKDLVVGGQDTGTLSKSPIYVLISQGDGTFRDETAAYIDGTAEAAFPVAAAGDVDLDGLIDLVVYDQGNIERGQAPAGGYYGEAPFVLLSSKAPSGKRWGVDTGLASAYQAITGDDKVHVKAIAVGDVDGDGLPDIVAESQGGAQRLHTHIVINAGNGSSWLPDLRSESPRIPRTITEGRPLESSHRHAGEIFADLDRDGHLDLVMGQLRKKDNYQDHLHSKVCWNSGSGTFHEDNVTELPHVSWNGGWTYAKTLTVTDLDEDGLDDLVLGHERGNDNALQDGNTGLYLQFLRNEGGRGFSDVTAEYFLNEGPMLAVDTSQYGKNSNMAQVEMRDMDADGKMDLVFSRSMMSISPNQPLVALAGSGAAPRWRLVDSQPLSHGRAWHGQHAIPIDLDGDGREDILWARRVCSVAGCQAGPSISELVAEIGPVLGVVAGAEMSAPQLANRLPKEVHQ